VEALETELSPSQFEEVRKQLHQGKSSKNVANLIQQTYKKMTDRKLSSMQTQLNRYRNHSMTERVAKALVEQGVPVRKMKIMDALDFAEQLDFITDTFRLRLVKMADLLMQVPMPPKEMRDELRAFSQHLSTSIDAYMKMGLIDGPPKEFEAVFNMDQNSGQLKFTVKENFTDGLKSLREAYATGPAGEAIEGEVLSQ
jgi:hypothetical protein